MHKVQKSIKKKKQHGENIHDLAGYFTKYPFNFQMIQNNNPYKLGSILINTQLFKFWSFTLNQMGTTFISQWIVNNEYDKYQKDQIF